MCVRTLFAKAPTLFIRASDTKSSRRSMLFASLSFNPPAPEIHSCGKGGIPVQNQHAVAVAVETIPFFDGMTVGTEYQVAPGKRRDEHQQGGFRQVEIGQQAAYDLESISRNDKQVRLTARGNNLSMICN